MNAQSPSTTAVRQAVAADIPEVLGIEEVSFADPWTAEAFRSSLSLPHIRFLVAEQVVGALDASSAAPSGARRLVGYVLALVLGPEGEIADIAVAPETRGGGVGGTLLDEMSSALARLGVRILYLEVRVSNMAARRLYASRGFDEVGRRRNYYQHPVEDALVLRRDLAPT